MRITGHCVLTIILGILVAAPVYAEVGVHVFGLSKHIQNAPYPYEGYEEFNPGLGVNWAFERFGRGSLEMDAVVFRNSDGVASAHLTLGASVRLLGPLEVALKLARSHSRSFNSGRPAVVPYPLVTLRGRRVALHTTYMPEVSGINYDKAFGFYATIYPWSGGWSRDPRRDPDSTSYNALEFSIGRDLRLQRYDGYSVAWRRMFSARHGLRLGLWFSAGTRDEESQGWDREERSYGAALQIQYLRRYRVEERIRPFWAAGIESRYQYRYYRDGDYRESADADTRESVIVGFGLELGLGPVWSVYAQYGLRYAWSYYESAEIQNGWAPEHGVGRDNDFEADMKVGILAAF